ncbi:hypothetical protein FL857_07610 [Criibacterium bergeronii]|uniref:Uncharacterized protein n=1 Tax=Criibacterium bergeronii TaxID=1871336 RepID=A0A552V3F9_9FIRM|nr:hypothetical protein [Criibacterium bergeronii]TRW24991.1 hypothetical protein FL857_07610 [Criibacterium bergeronii]
MTIGKINNTQSLNYLQTQQTKSNSQKMSPLEKQKINIQSQMQQINGDKTLSQEEKSKKVQALQEELDKLNEQLGKKQLEDIKDSGKKLAEEMAKDVEKEINEVEKEKKAQIAMNYGLISSTGEIGKQAKLTFEREKAVRKFGEGSDNVKRIDGMIEQSRKTGLAGAHLAAKAAAEYAKAKQANLEKEQEEKAAKQSQTPVQNNEVKVDNTAEKIIKNVETKEVGQKQSGEEIRAEKKQVEKTEFVPQKPISNENDDFVNSTTQPKVIASELKPARINLTI